MTHASPFTLALLNFGLIRFHLIHLKDVLEFLKTVGVTGLAFALVFGLLAFCHEFGHFLMAKMLGMSVEQFGIGLPPTHGWTLFRRSGTSYTLHPIPLGAFVRIQGMDPSDQDSPNSFLRRPAWARLIVLAAGSAANMLLAVLVFAFMAAVTGVPLQPHMTNEVDSVRKGSVAAAAGLKSGDKIMAIRRLDQPRQWVRPKLLARSTDATSLVGLIHHSYAWQTVLGKRVPVGVPLLVEVLHANGGSQFLRVRPSVTRNPETGAWFALLGYAPRMASEYQKESGIRAIGEGFDKARENALLLVTALYQRIHQLMHHQITAQQFGEGFGGPVAIASASGHFAKSGMADFLWFIGILSINLAVLNLLPLPIFDGGNIILVLVEVVRRKQLDPSQFMAVQLVGVTLMVCLFLYLTFKDVLKLASGAWLP